MRVFWRNRSIAYCLVLAIATVMLTFDYAGAPVRYRLGAGDEINLTAVTKINQGAGSGLDADKLDGKESADFVSSGAGGIKDTDIDFGLSAGQVNTDDVPEGTANKYFSGKGLKDLTDTPGSYTGQSGKVVAVKSTEDGVEFIASGSGETNTASNVGTGGVGVFKQKVGVDLEHKKINAGSNKVTITDDTGNDEIDIDVAEANIVHGNLSGSGTNTHAQIDTHLGSTSNPHSVTAAQLGAEETANKDAANGYAGLDGSTKLAGAQVPYGSAANTACEGNDSRLSDARAPSAHESTHEPLGSDALLLDEDDMVSDSATKGSSQQAIKKYTDDHVVQSTNVLFQRSAASGSGDQSVTGVGFTPTAVIFLAADDANTVMMSIGFGDDAVGEKSLYNSGHGSISWGSGGARVVNITDDGGNSMGAVLKTLDSDGFTVTWTKSGSGQDVTVVGIALR